MIFSLSATMIAGLRNGNIQAMPTVWYSEGKQGDGPFLAHKRLCAGNGRLKKRQAKDAEGFVVLNGGITKSMVNKCARCW